jgi:hypothetical protein
MEEEVLAFSREKVKEEKQRRQLAVLFTIYNTFFVFRLQGTKCCRYRYLLIAKITVPVPGTGPIATSTYSINYKGPQNGHS